MTATLTSARSASLTASQRVRVTLWFQTRRSVFSSSSRVTSGAPQKIPIRRRYAEQQRADQRDRRAVRLLEVVPGGGAVGGPRSRRSSVA